MPTFSEDLYEIVFRQVLLGQLCINVFYYKDEEIGPLVALGEVADAFEIQVAPDIFAVQSGDTLGLDLTVRRVGDVQERIRDLSTLSGDRTGPSAPSFTAWGFILNRSTIDTRNGGKRFAGISETDTDGNDPVPGINSPLLVLADSLKFNLDLDNGAVLKPFIFRRGSFVGPNYHGSEVADAAFTRITSQVSRKERPV